ncbi:MAG: hypothetical protein AAGI23_06800 [Bacteroidota bacterium]
MNAIYIIAAMIFLVTTFLLWKASSRELKKEYSEKARKSWVSRTYHWQGIIIYSTGITALLLAVLRWMNVLSF